MSWILVLTDSDQEILQKIQNFQKFSTKELVDFMIPDEYKFLSCTIVADNFYNTGESLLMLHSQGTSLLGTMRRNSTG